MTVGGDEQGPCVASRQCQKKVVLEPIQAYLFVVPKYLGQKSPGIMPALPPRRRFDGHQLSDKPFNDASWPLRHTEEKFASHYRRKSDRNATYLLNDLVKRKCAGQQIDMDTGVKEGDHSLAFASTSPPFPAVRHVTSAVLLPLPEEC